MFHELYAAIVTYTDVSISNLVRRSNHVDIRGDSDDGLSSEITIGHDSLICRHFLKGREMFVAGRRCAAFRNGQWVKGTCRSSGSQKSDVVDDVLDKHDERLTFCSGVKVNE